MSIRGLFLFLIVTLSLKGSAQLIHNPYFKNLDVEELALKSAGFQHWDSNGKLWLVTDKGLVSYNGYQTQLIAYDSSNTNTPLNAPLRSIQATGTDEFWITYHGHHGLSKFDPVKMQFRHYLMDSLNRFMLPPVDIVKMVKANDSIFWIPTWGYGICKLNAKTGGVKRYLADANPNSGRIPCNYVKEMLLLPNGRYMLGFFEEFPEVVPGYFDPATGLYEPFPIEPYLAKLNETQRANAKKGLTLINFIYPDEHQNLWIGTYIGVFKLDQKAQTVERISVAGTNLEIQNLENARNYIVDERGNLWIGTPNKGIMVIDLKSSAATYIRHHISNNFSLSDDRVLSMNKDPEGNIWISTGGGSFSIYFPVLQQFMLHPWNTMNLAYADASLQKIPVNQMLVLENGHVLISSQNGMLEYDPVSRTTVQEISPKTMKNIPRHEGILASSIHNFRKIGDEIHTHFIWKPADGSARWDFYPVHFNLYNQAVSVGSTPNKHSWNLFRHQPKGPPIAYVSSWKIFKLLGFDAETEEYTFEFAFPDSVQFSEVFSFPLKSGRWMISERNGRFIIFDPESQNYELYSHKSQLHFFPDSTVTCAYPDADGIVWIGTQNGLYRFDETTGKSEKQNAKIGLQEEEIVNAIIRDDNGVLWLALSKDLIRWDQQKNHVFRFGKTFGLECGSFIPSVAQKDAAGIIYIASINGILTFDPARLVIPSLPFQLFNDQISLFDSLVSNDIQQEILTGKKSFRYDENYLTFSFTTNQVFPLSPHTFQYKLIGRDDAWQHNGNSNTIRLADLSYGEYVLEVKAIDSFKRESNIVKIPFYITPPFWLTWWFYTIILLVVGACIFYYVKYREKALLKRSIELERTVTERTADVVREKKEADKQRLEAEHQKELVEEKQKEISDSINYAKRIQNAILPSNRFFKTNLPESFILYLPKDIVAGDFYFMENIGDMVILGVADCTGHGVPGAMVSVVCHNALTRSVKEFGLTQPHQILDKTRELVLETFAKSEDQVNDGMDIALCSIDRKNKTLYFAGANNGIFLFRNNALIEFKPDKQPIGKFIHAKPFSVQQIPFQTGDQFYLFSDGYADQFGGEAGKPGGKKFKYSRLKTLLQDIHLKPPGQQEDLLLKTLVEWRGEIEQVDDVCIVGFRTS